MGNKIKVCLAWHNINSTNYGVSALAVAQVALLKKAADELGVELTYETLGTHDASELGIKKELESRLGIDITHVNFSLRILANSLLKFDFSLFNIFKKYDLVIDIGEGDSFTDIYGMKRFLLISLTKYLAVSKGVKLILAPQTIGPFKTLASKVIAKYLIKRSELVFSRDYKSTAFVSELGLVSTEVSDVAFTLPFDKKEKVANSVGLNISGLLWHGGYSGANQFGLTVDYKEFVKQVVSGFLARGKQIHLIGHVISDIDVVEDDYRVCLNIKELFADEPNVIVAPKFRSPIEAKSYMSQLEFFTGSRMHATIGALSSGVVTVPIAYSRKFSGVFGSLDYTYTLDAYTLGTNELIEQLFAYYDKDFDAMEKAMAFARKTSLQRNDVYVTALKEILGNA